MEASDLGRGGRGQKKLGHINFWPCKSGPKPIGDFGQNDNFQTALTGTKIIGPKLFGPVSRTFRRDNSSHGLDWVVWSIFDGANRRWSWPKMAFFANFQKWPTLTPFLNHFPLGGSNLVARYLASSTKRFQGYLPKGGSFKNDRAINVWRVTKKSQKVTTYNYLKLSTIPCCLNLKLYYSSPRRI